MVGTMSHERGHTYYLSTIASMHHSKKDLEHIYDDDARKQKMAARSINNLDN